MPVGRPNLKELGQLLADFCETWPLFLKFRVMLATSAPNLAEIWQMSADFVRQMAQNGQFGSILGQFAAPDQLLNRSCARHTQIFDHGVSLSRRNAEGTHLSPTAGRKMGRGSSQRDTVREEEQEVVFQDGEPAAAHRGDKTQKSAAPADTLHKYATPLGERRQHGRATKLARHARGRHVGGMCAPHERRRIGTIMRPDR